VALNQVLTEETAIRMFAFLVVFITLELAIAMTRDIRAPTVKPIAPKIKAAITNRRNINNLFVNIITYGFKKQLNIQGY
jgi:hypothetical protein